MIITKDVRGGDRVGSPSPSHYPVPLGHHGIEAVPRPFNPIAVKPPIQTVGLPSNGSRSQGSRSRDCDEPSALEALNSGATMGRRGLLIDEWA